ncbi:MAG: RNA 3'-terminal phosphate cyclase [Candidatus Micrarchaeia archaeon]
MIEVKADEMEGGGQVLRSSISLSSVFGVPVKLFNIRAKRAKPGMQAQHLMGVEAAARITSAEVQGLEKGSMQLIYTPKTINAGKFNFNIGTAGSSMLVLQTILPIALFSPSETQVRIIGGTHVAWSPNFHFVKEVFLPIIKKMGCSLESFELERAGWYPKGGGAVKLLIKPINSLKPIQLTSPGKMIKILGISCCSNLPETIPQRQASAARKLLIKNGYDAEIEEVTLPSYSKGSALTLWAIYENTILGASSLGELGKKSEVVGEEAAKNLLEEMKSGAALDSHMGDQVLIYMGLAKGESSVTVSKLTSHIKTNIWVIEQFINSRFRIEEFESGVAKITIEGVGLERAQRSLEENWK